MTRPFYIVDVFAERLYAGNQLAVVVGTEDLSDDTMQQIAAETNYSETTFVASARELGLYLLEHRFFSDSNFGLRIEQGHEIRRPSL